MLGNFASGLADVRASAELCAPMADVPRRPLFLSAPPLAAWLLSEIPLMRRACVVTAAPALAKVGDGSRMPRLKYRRHPSC